MCDTGVRSGLLRFRDKSRFVRAATNRAGTCIRAATWPSVIARERGRCGPRPSAAGREPSDGSGNVRPGGRSEVEAHRKPAMSAEGNMYLRKIESANAVFGPGGEAKSPLSRSQRGPAPRTLSPLGGVCAGAPSGPELPEFGTASGVRPIAPVPFSFELG